MTDPMVRWGTVHDVTDESFWAILGIQPANIEATKRTVSDEILAEFDAELVA